MTLAEKLNRRTGLAERYRWDALLAFQAGLDLEYVKPLFYRYVRASRLVDLTAQKAIEERQHV